MSKFTDLYKSMNPDRSQEGIIRDNPIMAYVSGVAEGEIRDVLSRGGWPAGEIDDLLTQAKHAKVAVAANRL